jgi:hypothetical protein
MKGPVRDRLAKLFAMLGSDNAGERETFVRAWSAYCDPAGTPAQSKEFGKLRRA